MDEGKEGGRKESRKETLKYGCIDGWMDERKEEKTDVCVYGSTDGQMGRRKLKQ